MSIIKQFKKQGGLQLFKQWWFSKSLLYAISIIPFFINSKVGLEIFRLAVTNNTHKHIVKQFENKNLPVLSNKINTPLKKVKENELYIWFMWLQGLDEAPELVKTNYKMLIKIYGENNVRLITESNLYDYIELPNYILNKRKDKIISATHFSDIVRIQLLALYGGMWVDSTVFFSHRLPKIILDQEFFVPQTLKPGRDGSAIPVSNWLIISKRHNKITFRIRDLLFDYWKQYDKVIDYFIFHHFIMIAFEEFRNEYSRVLPYDNTQAHALLITMKNYRISDSLIKEYVELSPMHKLTNKLESSLEKDNQKQLINYIEKIL